MQTHKAISPFKKKYPQCQGLFAFDNAPSHMKRQSNALNVDRMNVRGGGKQPFMRDTVWHGKTHQMVTAEGVQKGMRMVLEERSLDTRGIDAKKMREQFQASYDITNINL